MRFFKKSGKEAPTLRDGGGGGGEARSFDTYLSHHPTKDDVSSWYLESAVRARAQRQFWLLLWRGTASLWATGRLEALRRDDFLLWDAVQAWGSHTPFSPVFSTILENDVLLFPSKFLAKCPHSILLFFSSNLRVLPSSLCYLGVIYCRDYARVTQTLPTERTLLSEPESRPERFHHS